MARINSNQTQIRMPDSIKWIGQEGFESVVDPSKVFNRPTVTPLRVGRGYRLGMAYTFTDLRILKNYAA